MLYQSLAYLLEPGCGTCFSPACLQQDLPRSKSHGLFKNNRTCSYTFQAGQRSQVTLPRATKCALVKMSFWHLPLSLMRLTICSSSLVCFIESMKFVGWLRFARWLQTPWDKYSPHILLDNFNKMFKRSESTWYMPYSLIALYFKNINCKNILCKISEVFMVIIDILE